ncbi:MAG TPA: hypothetical protein VK576_09410, partial [Thermoleophilia bacterium]|nr:hypothetical protein [Thermoleophilia bacterium]
GHDVTGTWGASDRLLGSAVVTVSRASDGGYQVRGVHIGGTPPAEVKRGDDGLVVTGGSGGSAWTLTLTFANSDQLKATVTFADGRPGRATVLTRR